MPAISTFDSSTPLTLAVSTTPRAAVAGVKRLVVKIGSALLTNDGRGLDDAVVIEWCRQIVAAADSGLEILLVSSGAIASGMQALGWRQRPTLMGELQAAAAVGQMGLCRLYRDAFAALGRNSAQILLTHDDLSDRQRYLNARAALLTLLDLGVIPVINENDTVVTEEIKFGDNDTLAALVANLVEADLLVILTDQPGLYTADPRRQSDAELLPEVAAADPRLEAIAGGAGTAIGRGGMLTKVLAAKRAARSGAHTLVASGREAGVLVRLLKGERLGTLFVAATPPMAARKQWLADHLQLAGYLTLDDGAVDALYQGKSLLPVGVAAVSGDFERGAAVACNDARGREVARGLINYSSEDARRIVRRPSQDIMSVLGYMHETEMIHRNNLVCLGSS